jgi:hypothetical protein
MRRKETDRFYPFGKLEDRGFSATICSKSENQLQLQYNRTRQEKEDILIVEESQEVERER